MNIFQKIIPICLFLFMGNLMFAQVKFKLTQLEDGKTYQVSLIPETTFHEPMNATSTAQVTLKVPTGALVVDQILNLQPEVEWDRNSLTERPEESPEFDYHSFGLVSQGTKKIVYEAGIEVPLFAFTNSIDCQGEVSLIDNTTDPFKFPNSQLVNIGNQITILGAQGDAYSGNTNEFVVVCGAQLTNIETIDKNIINLNLFPNPATLYLHLDFDWQRKGVVAHLALLDLTGKVVKEKVYNIQKGKNLEKLDIQPLAQGTYFIEITGDYWNITSNQFIKMAH